MKAYADNEADPYLRPLSPGDFIGAWIVDRPRRATAGSPPSNPDAPYIRSSPFSRSSRASRTCARSRIRTLEEKGRLSIHGAYFGVADGRLLAFDEPRGKFVPIAEDAWRAAFAAPLLNEADPASSVCQRRATSPSASSVAFNCTPRAVSE